MFSSLFSPVHARGNKNWMRPGKWQKSAPSKEPWQQSIPAGTQNSFLSEARLRCLRVRIFWFVGKYGSFGEQLGEIKLSIKRTLRGGSERTRAMGTQEAKIKKVSIFYFFLNRFLLRSIFHHQIFSGLQASCSVIVFGPRADQTGRYVCSEIICHKSKRIQRRCPFCY